MTLRCKDVRCFGAAILLMALTVTSAHAQKNDPPSGQFGVGIYLITNYLPNGFEVTYALDSDIEIGSALSLSISNSVGTYLVSPFARYLFPELFPGIVSPFVQGGFQLYSVGSGTQTGVFLGGGAAYYISHEIGIHGDVDIFNLMFGSSGTNLGWFVFRIGADYFF
jgi:hypothetical protein